MSDQFTPMSHTTLTLSKDEFLYLAKVVDDAAHSLSNKADWRSITPSNLGDDAVCEGRIVKIESELPLLEALADRVGVSIEEQANYIKASVAKARTRLWK